MIWQDFRFGLRMMLKQPGFTLVAVLILALGIGANSAIFNGVSAFILRPLPGVAEPESLVVPFQVDHEGDRSDSYSYPDFVDYQNRNRTFEGLLAHRLVQVVFGASDQKEVIYGEMVSGNYFDLLRVKPLLGRTFAPDEDRTANSHPVVVISHDLWRNRFASDPAVVGKEVTLNGSPFTIIGVTGPGFQGTKWGLGLDFQVPMAMQQRIIPGSNRLNSRGDHWFQVIGRLKPGMSLSQGADDLTAIARQLDQDFPNERGRDNKVILLPENEGRFNDSINVIKLGSVMAMAVVGVILLIVCANIASLLLARSLTRRREISIRLALGAGRWRLIRQLLTESVMLSLLGGVLGLMLSFWLSDLILHLAPVLPYRLVLNTQMDWTVILFTLGLSLLAGIVFGLMPALQTSNPDLIPALKGEESSLRSGKKRFTLRNVLVVAQVVLSLVVLISAGLFIRSFQNAQAFDPGFSAGNAVAMTVTPGLLGYEKERGQIFYQQLVERVRALPGVQSAALINELPLGDSSSSTGPIVPEGQPAPTPGEGLNVMYTTSGSGYFRTMQIPLLRGREFDETDRKADGRRVIVINETAARRLWPQDEAIGKRVSIGGNSERLYEVVGVARDGKYRSLGESPRPFIWFPLSQSYETDMTLVVKSAGDPQNIVSAVRNAVRSLDAGIPLASVKTLKQHLTQTLWGPQMGAVMATAFGVLAMLLATMGLYSVIAFAVRQRTRELGIRMALGAQQRQVVMMVAAQGMRLALTGILIGLPVAFAFSRLLAGLLYGISGADPLIFVGVTFLLSFTGFLASYFPARRAARVNPLEALRYE